MITLETDQAVPNTQFDYRVLTGGEFEDDELVPCYQAEDSERQPIVAFPAKLIAGVE